MKIIITGAMGTGKTSIIDCLKKKHGVDVSTEVARELITEFRENSPDKLPWNNRPAFEKALVEARVKEFIRARPGVTTFFDRGIPETLSFFQFDGLEIPEWMIALVEKYRYYRKVFFLEPWRDIYVQDAARPNSFSESERISPIIKKTYIDLGYDIVVVPNISISDRASWILDRSRLWRD